MKIFRFIGIAICASLIAASCEKQAVVAPEAPVAEEEVSFEELTKEGMPELEAVSNDVNAAVNNISESVAYQLEGAVYNQSTVDDFVTYLFDQFTYFIDYHNFDTTSFKVSYPVDVYKLLTEIGLLIKNASVSEVDENFITVDFENNQLVYSTQEGYVLTVKFPDWKFYFTADKWPKLTRDGNSIVVELSKTTSKEGEEETSTIIASADYELFNEGSTGNVVIKFFGEGKVVAKISFSFNKSDLLIDESTFVASYNNTEGVKGVSNTSIKLTNPSDLEDAIGKMGVTEYSFEEASAIADTFNANVVDDNGLEPYAYIAGRYLRAQPVLNEETGMYTVRAAISKFSDYQNYRLVSNRTLVNLFKIIIF